MVIAVSFKKSNLTHLTTDVTFSEQRFAILPMFGVQYYLVTTVTTVIAVTTVTTVTTVPTVMVTF